MSVIRVKKDKNFFAASNVPFNDENLSWEARGVMGYLLSKPDDWQVRFTDLVNKGSAGAYKIRKILKELEENGYLNREKYRTEGGTYDWVSIIYETPAMSRELIYGDPTGGGEEETDPISGNTIYQSTIYGKPRDILNTESLNTNLNTEEEGEFPNVMNAYEKEIGPLTPMIGEELAELEKEHTPYWVVQAMKQAAIQNVRRLSYFKAILERWKVDGYGTEKKSNHNGRSKKKGLSEAEMLAELEARRGKQ